MNSITIESRIDADVEKVWHYWNTPESIKKWAFASDDWECPYSENDLRIGGKSITRMAAKDGSASFDIQSTYTEIVPLEKITYVMDDGRKVEIFFENLGNNQTKVIETFEMESENSEELQRSGWQSILDNFKKFVESQ